MCLDVFDYYLPGQ